MGAKLLPWMSNSHLWVWNYHIWEPICHPWVLYCDSCFDCQIAYIWCHIFMSVCQIGNFGCQYKHPLALCSHLLKIFRSVMSSRKAAFLGLESVSLASGSFSFVITMVYKIAQWHDKKHPSRTLQIVITSCSTHWNLPKNGLAQEFDGKVHPALNFNLWVLSRHFNCKLLPKLWELLPCPGS